MGMVAAFIRVKDTEVAALRADAQAVERAMDGAQQTDVDKAWHAIHFLLTATAGDARMPLGFILSGGEEVGEDMGYGAARLLTASEVKTLAEALPTRAALMQRFDASKLEAADIYPNIWDRPQDEDDTEGYVGDHYEQLLAFIVDAAAQGEALLVAMI